jgi:hypothetical protein
MQRTGSFDRRYLVSILAQISLLTAAARADFTHINPPAGPSPEFPNGEQSHAQIIGHRYGGTFQAVAGSKDFSNGLLRAERVPDSINGQSGTPLQLNGIITEAHRGQMTDQLWQNAFDFPEAEAVFASFPQEFGYLDGSGEGPGTFNSLLRITGLGYGVEINQPFPLLPQNKELRWADRSQGRPPYPPRQLSSRNADNLDVRDHMVSYLIRDENPPLGQPAVVRWLLFFEDLLAGEPFEDFDFNDLAVEVKVVNERWINSGSGNWDQPSNWGTGVVPNGPEAVASFLQDITSPATVTLNNPITINRMRLLDEAGYTIVGGPANNTLTFDGGTNNVRSVNAQLGSHSITAPIRIIVPDDLDARMHLNVAQAQDVLAITGEISVSAANNVTLTIQKTGPGRVDINKLEPPPSSTQQTSLTINGGTLRFLAGSGRSYLNSLTIAGGTQPTAKLDIEDNPVVVDYASQSPSPLAAIKAQVVTAFNGGSWDANGISSSKADATTFGVGYGEASALTSVPVAFGSVDSTAVLLRVVPYGDATLDGSVGIPDFNRLADNLGLVDATWVHGDFNYDGRVTIQDFNRLAGLFGLSASPQGPTPGDWANLVSIIPEPSAAGLVLAILSLSHRRRHR